MVPPPDPVPTVLPEMLVIRDGLLTSGGHIERNPSGRSENIDAKIQGLRAVHIGKFDLQQDLLLLRRDLDFQQIDYLAECEADRLSALRGIYVFDGAGEIDGGGIAGNLNAVRRIRCEFALSPRPVCSRVALHATSYSFRLPSLSQIIALVSPGALPLIIRLRVLTGTASAVSGDAIEIRSMSEAVSRTKVFPEPTRIRAPAPGLPAPAKGWRMPPEPASSAISMMRTFIVLSPLNRSRSGLIVI